VNANGQEEKHHVIALPQGAAGVPGVRADVDHPHTASGVGLGDWGSGRAA